MRATLLYLFLALAGCDVEAPEVSRYYVEVGTFGGGLEFHPLVLDPPVEVALHCATWRLDEDMRLVPVEDLAACEFAGLTREQLEGLWP